MEIIIVDDASTDNSVDILKQFVDRYPSLIRLTVNQKNEGNMVSINRALERISGEYVHFTAADDKMLPGFYEKFLSLLARHPQAGLCSALGRVIGEKGEDLGPIRVPIVSDRACFFTPKQAATLFRKAGPWFVPGPVIFRRDIVAGLGGFDPELRSHTDYFLMRIIALRHGVCYIPEELSLWRKLEKGILMTVSADSDAQVDILRREIRLWQSPKYCGDIPPAYVRDWAREDVLGMVERIMSRRREQAYRLMGEARPLLDWKDRFFIQGLGLAPSMESLLWRIYFFARLSREPILSALCRKAGLSTLSS